METKSRTRKKGRIVLLTALIVLAAVIVGCIAYIQDYYPAWDGVQEAAAIDGSLPVETADGWIACGNSKAGKGLIFYPGSKVEETAYIPLMAQIARKGYFCVLVRMPARLAILDSGAAGRVMEAYPEIGDWYLGGHSLGGAMAASYAAGHPEDLKGLVLLAAYSTSPLPETLPVLSLYGSEDNVLNREKYRECLGNLPEGYAEFVIEGGNHAGFGWYGPQAGDGESTLSAGEQWSITAEQFARWEQEP